MTLRFVVADVETCGLGADKFDLTEVALQEINPITLEAVWSWEALCNPGRLIPEKVVQLNGITDDMVANSPSWAIWLQSADGPRTHFGDDEICIIAHNAAFDVDMLLPLGKVRSTICTLESAKRLLPKDAPKSKSLQSLREHFGLPDNEHHRAMGDVINTGRVLKQLLQVAGCSLEQFVDQQSVLVMPFGVPAGNLMSSLTDEYLLWLRSSAQGLGLSTLMCEAVDRQLKHPKRVEQRGKLI